MEAEEKKERLNELTEAILRSVCGSATAVRSVIWKVLSNNPGVPDAAKIDGIQIRIGLNALLAMQLCQTIDFN